MQLGGFTIYPDTIIQSDMFVTTCDTAGNYIGMITVANASSYDKIMIDNNNGIYVGGFFLGSIKLGDSIFNNKGGNDGFLAKLGNLSAVGVEHNIAIDNSDSELFIYANPTKGPCNIEIPEEFNNEKNLTLSIYDNTGKLLQQISVQMNSGNVKLNLEEEAKGIYNVILTNGKKKYNGKVVFE